MRRQESPLTHEWIWRAIDTLALRQGLTPSGLARLAGLDATAFNRSKRFTPEGRPRWPSTESIAKVLEATATALDEFATIELDAATAPPRPPMLVRSDLASVAPGLVSPDTGPLQARRPRRSRTA